MQAHATATHSVEGLIVATGEIDTALEGIYILDAVTGDISGAVLNPSNRKFGARWTYSGVMKDLGLAQVKNPKFVMVTGVAETRQGYRGGKLGRAILYVAELNSGSVAAYGVPWQPSKMAAGQAYTDTLVPLDWFKFRNAVIRE